MTWFKLSPGILVARVPGGLLYKCTSKWKDGTFVSISFGACTQAEIDALFAGLPQA